MLPYTYRYSFFGARVNDWLNNTVKLRQTNTTFVTHLNEMLHFYFLHSIINLYLEHMTNADKRLIHTTKKHNINCYHCYDGQH